MAWHREENGDITVWGGVNSVVERDIMKYGSTGENYSNMEGGAVLVLVMQPLEGAEVTEIGGGGPGDGLE